MLERAAAGEVMARRLTIRGLEPGAVGVLDVEVVTAPQVRTFQKRAGGEGRLAKVMLRDATGEIEATLWGHEIEANGPDLVPGNRVRLLGPLVKAGYRGGVELGLSGCRVEALPAARPVSTWHGRIVAIGTTTVTDGPRFHAEVELATGAGRRTVVAWDEALLALRRLGVGESAELDVEPHPVVAEWGVVKEGRSARPGRKR